MALMQSHNLILLILDFLKRTSNPVMFHILWSLTIVGIHTANPRIDYRNLSIDKTGTGYINYDVTNFIENTNQTFVTLWLRYNAPYTGRGKTI